MRILFVVFFILFSCENAKCQNLGLAISSDFSTDKKVIGSLGPVIFAKFPIFNDRFDFQLASFVTINNNKLIESDRNFFIQGIISDYMRIGGSASTVYTLPISNIMKFKIGLSVSYNYMQFRVIPIPLNYFENYSLNSIGSGFRVDYNFKFKEDSNLSFDIILDAAYLFRLHDSGSFPENAKLNNTILYTFLVAASMPISELF